MHSHRLDGWAIPEMQLEKIQQMPFAKPHQCKFQRLANGIHRAPGRGNSQLCKRSIN
jgi:hypothetical protein